VKSSVVKKKKWYLKLFFLLVYSYKFSIIVLSENKKKMIKIKLLIKRLEKQLSQEEISDLVGMTQSTYSRKEKGITKITISEWTKIAKVLGVEKEEIFEPINPKIKLSNIIENGFMSNPSDIMEQINYLQKENFELKERLRNIENR
jgi:transcriptional regulator with XRE-family HTH domain